MTYSVIVPTLWKSNLDKFYEIFNINENDSMYLKPELRSRIW